MSEEIKGAAYIYNFSELVNNHVVGNVFYKNGKMILSNSGSVFDELLKDRSDTTLPKYDIDYKSQQTIYEKQILCRIEPGEFNFSTNPTSLIPNTFVFDIDRNGFFDFIDLDLICRYISTKIKSDYKWYNYFEFTESEYNWFVFYYKKYDLYNKPTSYINQYTSYLESIYSTFDVDGNNKIHMSDVYLMFKYFINELSKDVVFKYVDIKSSRKTAEAISNYLDTNIGKYAYGSIKSEFFAFDYSSSLDVTGSYLAPFITTIGLYNGSELVAVAKLGMPIKNSGELPLNILVKWDI
jgi:hypothetical protein